MISKRTFNIKYKIGLKDLYVEGTFDKDKTINFLKSKNRIKTKRIIKRINLIKKENNILRVILIIIVLYYSLKDKLNN